MTTRRTTPERLDELVQQRHQLDARISALSARARLEAKRDEDRLKWLLGSLVHERIGTDAELRAFVMRELPSRLTERDRQRGLLDKLLPKSED